ncbi:hypothetical protein ABIC65_001117 [Sphingomonas trueperi]
MQNNDLGRIPSEPGSQASPEAACAASPVGADPLRLPYRCSFCAKTEHEVRKLIAGPDVYICDECVGLCGSIVNRNSSPAMDVKSVDERLSAFASHYGLTPSVGMLGMLGWVVGVELELFMKPRDSAGLGEASPNLSQETTTNDQG